MRKVHHKEYNIYTSQIYSPLGILTPRATIRGICHISPVSSAKDNFHELPFKSYIYPKSTNLSLGKCCVVVDLAFRWDGRGFESYYDRC